MNSESVSILFFASFNITLLGISPSNIISCFFRSFEKSWLNFNGLIFFKSSNTLSRIISAFKITLSFKAL